MHGRAKRRAARAIALVAASALTLAACGGDDGDDTDTTTPPADATTTTAPSGAGGGGDATDAAVIVIQDVAFTTPDVTVTVGGSVTFDNQDAQAHTANGDGGSFDTGTIKAGEKSEVTFDTAGTFTYFCAFHPFMKGTVTVE
jgi:plastocyanin